MKGGRRQGSLKWQRLCAQITNRLYEGTQSFPPRFPSPIHLVPQAEIEPCLTLPGLNLRHRPWGRHPVCAHRFWVLAVQDTVPTSLPRPEESLKKVLRELKGDTEHLFNRITGR
jgi:hypothetical protein